MTETVLNIVICLIFVACYLGFTYLLTFWTLWTDSIYSPVNMSFLLHLVVNFQKSVVEAEGKTFHFDPLGIPAQELIVAGGLQKWVKKRLTQS